MPGAGFDPALPEGKGGLSPPRLPIPPPGLVMVNLTLARQTTTTPGSRLASAQPEERADLCDGPIVLLHMDGLHPDRPSATHHGLEIVE